MPLEVRRALPGDATTLAHIAGLTFPLACPPHTTEEAKAAFIAENLGVDSFARYLVDPQRALFLAEDAGTALGYTMLIAGDPADPDVAAVVTARPTIELSKCYVLPEAHGSGAAAELMARSLEHAVEAGARSVWLGVNQENGRAQRFYGKHGFVEAGVKRFLVGGRYEDDFVFVHPL